LSRTLRKTAGRPNLLDKNCNWWGVASRNKTPISPVEISTVTGAEKSFYVEIKDRNHADKLS
jgi:hypothetical protein